MRCQHLDSSGILVMAVTTNLWIIGQRIYCESSQFLGMFDVSEQSIPMLGIALPCRMQSLVPARPCILLEEQKRLTRCQSSQLGLDVVAILAHLPADGPVAGSAGAIWPIVLDGSAEIGQLGSDAQRFPPS